MDYQKQNIGKEKINIYFTLCKLVDGYTITQHIKITKIYWGLLKKLPNNCKFCFGVPNYDAKGHVRYFISRQHIIDRYGKYLNIEKIVENKFNTNSIIYIIEGTTK